MTIITAAHYAIAFVFISLIIYAMISDMKFLIIKNWISVALIATFALHAALSTGPFDLTSHIIAAAGFFVAGFFLFSAGWISGGDVKLMTAVSLWAGPELIFPFAFLTTWLGLGLASAVLGAQWLNKHGEAVGMPSHMRLMIPRWAKHGLVPYGIAIGLAALIIVPARLF